MDPITLGPRGRRFWDETLKVYGLNPGELLILQETCRTLDVLDQLDATIRNAGPLTAGSSGQEIVHPAVGEALAQRIALHRLLASLALPDADGNTVQTARKTTAKAAARARWAPLARKPAVG